MCSPKNFIYHPVANSREKFLHQQDCLDECSLSPLQNIPDQFKGKGIGMNLGWQVVPPFGGVLSLMVKNSTKLAGVAKDEAPIRLSQYEGVVLGGWIHRILFE